MTRLTRRAFLTLVAALSLSCGQGDGPITVVHPLRTDTGPVFRFNNDTEPETLDPAMMTGSPEFNVSVNLFEGLTTPHPETLEPQPALAESWEISPDGLTYTFHLRKNAVWSNGDPVTARDFVYSWKRVLTPSTRSMYAYQLFYLKNAEGFHRKDQDDYDGPKIADWSEVGLRAADDYTLVVELASPCAFFLNLCGFHTLLPVNEKCVETYREAWTRPENIVTNGPFLLAEHHLNNRIVLKKNPAYYDAASVRLETVIIHAIEDQNTSLQKYEAGELDVTSVPLSYIDTARRRSDVTIYDLMTTYFYRFNVNVPPLDDARVRRALNMAVDKKTICEYVLKAGQKPAASFVPPTMPNYSAVEGLPYDPEKARQLLAEAGYPEGKGFPRLDLVYNTSEGHRTIAQVIQNDWQKNLSIPVTLTNKEWKVFLADMNNLQYQIARSAWIGDYPDPNTFLDMWVTDGGNNRTGWSHPRYDQLIRDAAVELDPAKRMSLFHEAEQILCVEELPIMPVYFYTGVSLKRPEVRGYYYNLQSLHPMKYVWIDEGSRE